MPHYSVDVCTGCGKQTSPELLMIIRVQFMRRTAPSKVVRSRSKAWLCEACLEKNEDWKQEPYKSPGHTSPNLERVRAARNEPK